MTQRADIVRDLFQSALDLPEGERAAFVAEAAAGDAQVEREVLGLLGALAAATGFLTETRRTHVAPEGPGTVLDRYRLVAPIGEGGFGVVYRAEQQEPLRREVAVKVLKLGMDTRAVTTRFERERQTLARMQHPGIAAVFDGGTTPSGRPYFVMELVPGLPIAQFCREQGLGIAERIELLLQVCLAVQHAHQKGVVHRDLKPANILVGRAADGRPQPKVIDFGIAKVAWGDDAGEPTFTATRPGQAIGTLEYMAPEQAAGDLSQLDSRADVYSLGVVLYELLTGRRPFERTDTATSSTTSLVERIRDEAPLRPSTRIAAGDAELPLPGADRQRWRRDVAEDLDWIVAHALAKHPGERYPTADALAKDLRNFLDGRPVSVGPPRLSYLVRKFVGRHRAIVSAALLLVLSLVGGIVATAQALASARSENAHKQRTLQATRNLLLAADPHAQKGPDYTVRQMLDDFAPSIEAQFDDDPQVAASLHLTVGASYRNLAQLEAAESHLQRALELARTGGDPLVREAALIEWFSVLRELDRYDEAAVSLEGALQLARERAPGSVDVARLQLDRADLHRLRDEPDLGEPIARAALMHLDKAPDGAQVRATRGYAFDLLGAFALQRGDATAASALHEQALTLRESSYPAGHPLIAVSLGNLAAAQRRLGKLDEALATTERALAIERGATGERHPLVAQSLATLGAIELERNRPDAAEKAFTQALEIRTTTLPPGHPSLASSHADLGRLALARRKPMDAERHFRNAIAVREQGSAAADRALAGLWTNLGVAVDQQRRHDEAETIYRRAIALHRQSGGEGDAATTDAMFNLALALASQRRFAEAVEVHQQVLALRQQHQAADLARQLRSQISLADAALAAGQPAVAAAAQSHRAELMQRLGEDAEHIAAIQMRAGKLFLDVGDVASATPLLETAHAFCVEHVPGQWPRGECAALLAECRIAKRQWEPAVALAEEGVKLLRGSPAPADRLARAERCLAAAKARTEIDR